jgi:hypothetical protein
MFIRSDMNLITDILFGKLPPASVRGGCDDLYPKGLTMGSLIIGRPGSGKTSSLARQIVDYFLTHPDEPIFVLDWSGPITDSILTLILQQPEEVCEKAVKRLVYDELGNSEWVIPMPEFSELYGTKEEQVERVVESLVKANQELMERTPVMGGLAIENAAHFFRLCAAITNEHDESWQITEVKKLIVDTGLLRRALNKFGGQVPEAKYFIEKVFLEKNEGDRQLSTYALLSLLGAVEPREVRARFGYYRPGWTPKEAVEKGQMVIVNGEKLINRENAKNYCFTQVFSLILQELKSRSPSDPNLRPLTMVLDETYGLTGIPGVAKQIGELPSQYRSRKLQLFVVLQSLSQLAPPLDEQIWSLGNKTVFAVENKNEAEELAHQLFKYDPRYEKQPARTLGQNKITEPETGQDRLIADWIQNLRFRECLIRRFISERQLDNRVRHIHKTREHPHNPPSEPLYCLKDRLLKERGVRVRDALEIINQREITREVSKPPTV